MESRLEKIVERMTEIGRKLIETKILKTCEKWGLKGMELREEVAKETEEKRKRIGYKNRHHFVSRQSSFSRRLLGIVNVTLLINVLRLVRLLFPFLSAPTNSASLFLDYEKNVSLNCIPFDGTGNCLRTTGLPILSYCLSFLNTLLN